MPADSRRINGPEETVPYEQFSTVSTCQPTLETSDVRKDNRKLDEHRKIFLKTNVVTQAKGSAYVEWGRTKVIVSVYEPREIPNRSDYSISGELYCEFKYAPFSCRKRRQHQMDSEERLYSGLMKQALEPATCRHEFPNFQVDVYAMVLENAGGALAAAITGAGLALANAAVPMYDILTATTIATNGEIVLLDPTDDECSLCCDYSLKPLAKKPATGYGTVMLSMLKTHEQITQYYQYGNLDYEDIKKLTTDLIEANKEIALLVEKCLVVSVKNSLSED